MEAPIFHELKKQASFFLKDKIRTARLALTDVTPAQLMVEEATSGNHGRAADATTLKMISRAAFEVDDYWRIVDTLHKRLERFDVRSWREAYKALVVVEHLLTHGPQRVAEEFQCDVHVITQMETFQYVDDKGFDWGQTVRKKSERILKLLEKGPVLKEERDRARKVSRGIEGFGSFKVRTSQKTFDRCNSECADNTKRDNDNFFKAPNENNMIKKETHKPLLRTLTRLENLESKENIAPSDTLVVGSSGESKPLLRERIGENRKLAPSSSPQ